MLRAPLAIAVLSALATAGCSLPPTATARLNEAAYEFNDAARFGRMDIASEHVREIAREEFGRKHAAWGKAIRVVDIEMGSMSMRKDGDADVFVTLSWQRDGETTLHTTDLVQRWTSTRGNWAIISEAERGGDRGLLGEPDKPKDDAAAAPSAEAPATTGAPAGAPSPAAALRSRYQTRVIYEQ